MSLVTLIRDYVDVANSSEQLDGYTFSSLAYNTFGLLFSILKQVIVNFCTFQWVRDFSYFCLTPPIAFSSFANINISEGNLFASFLNSIDTSSSTGAEHQSLSNLVAFSETHFLSSIGLIFLGFFNGCLTSMHISAVNLITIQRLLVQGLPAGVCSAFGTAIGQCFFLACVHFGLRGFLFPWISLEPLPFLLGISILLAIASNSAQDRRTPTIQWSAKSSLLIYTFTSVILAWCEQTALFQLMGNLSFGAEPTLLETTFSFKTIGTLFENIQQIVKNGSYLLAFFLGNFLGTFFLAYLLQRLLEVLLSFKGIPIYYGLIKQANLPLATLIFAFGFGSLPYYGFDYLITKGFGFIPQEQIFQQTLFSPVNLVSKTSQTKEPTQGRLEDQLALLFTLEGEKKKSFVVDTTPFDDGQYLKAGQKRPQAFEDLNYRGEHLWTNRLSRISNIREQANQTQSSFLGPVFSWMRSFLWGEGPTTNNSEPAKNSLSVPSDSVLSQIGPNPKGLRSWENDARHNVRSSEDVTQYPIRSVESEQLQPFAGKGLADLRTSLEENSQNNFLKYRKELSAEKKQLDNYVKEFDQQFDKGFSNYHNAEPISLIEVEDQWQEQRIKEKCYTNPIYTFLLNMEIDSFLGRQPNSHRLSADEEILLLKRRQLLSNYYDTLALTSQIPISQTFNQLVPKSYTNAIYNHQFKGTLKIARRLFSIALPTFDQPLFSKEEILPSSDNSQLQNSDSAKMNWEQNKILFHEELSSNQKENAEEKRGHFYEVPRQDPSGVEKLYVELRTKRLASDAKHSKEGETSSELRTLTRGKKQIEDVKASYPSNALLNYEAEGRDKNVFLLEQAESLPLYASWDEGLRKLILTNRFQSRIKAGYSYAVGQDLPETVQSQILQGKDSRVARSSLTDVSFTAWPLPNPLLLPFPQEKNFEKQGNLIASDTFNSKNQFLFPTHSRQALTEPATNEMIHALLQWQKLIKDSEASEQLSKEDRQAAKEKVSYWPKNVRRANWSTELMDNDIEFEEPAETALKKQIILWEFIPPNYGGFIWPGIK